MALSRSDRSAVQFLAISNYVVFWTSIFIKFSFLIIIESSDPNKFYFTCKLVLSYNITTEDGKYDLSEYSGISIIII